MWTLTGFADEIDQNLELQFETLASEGMRYFDLRAVWNTNVLALSDTQVGQIRSALQATGISVSAIASPTGKIGIRDDFAPHLEGFKRGLELANRLNAHYVRIFSYFIPAGDDPAIYRGEVIERTESLVRAAEGTGVTLVHENERHIYGDTPERCLDLLAAIGSPVLRAVWDPANFVQVIGAGARPHDQGYDLLRPYLAYIHVKDAVASSGHVVPAGEGDGQIRETVSALRADGFDGFFSLEPHLASGGAFSGFSGPDLFRKAVQAFKGVLTEQGIQWA